MQKLSTPEKLRLKFGKSITKVASINAELDPAPPDHVALLSEPGETFIVKVIRRGSGDYWFSDSRVLLERESTAEVVAEYDRVRRAHWMFKDLRERFAAAQLVGEGTITAIKLEHFDRIELELDDRVVVLDGLGQAYWPTLHFFWWIEPHEPPAGSLH